MKTAKIIIGANFGDEGKGLITDYFANQVKKQQQSCLVVCHNGGSQKGHTVVSSSGFRHVFHHFGSGSFAGAATYLASKFIVNPILFSKELAELKRKGVSVTCFVNQNCRVTTPFDMMLNQIVEEYRGTRKHGSCGLGIFETMVRADRISTGNTIDKLLHCSVYQIRDWLVQIAEQYLPYRLCQLGVDTVPTEWMEILGKKDGMIENFIQDFFGMLEHIVIVSDAILEEYDCVLFEGAQGLLLDQNNTAYMPHLTPSNTGIKNPLCIIGKRDVELEVCYVSRTYMTRHGAGRLDTECRKADINAKMVDLTNVPNPYQDVMRYGKLDLDELQRRIALDLESGEVEGKRNIKKSVIFTHWDEYRLDRAEIERIFIGYRIYFSDGMTWEDVEFISRD